MVRHSAELHFRADDPVADGHFPGNRIIPAAALLRDIVRAVSNHGAAVCCEIHAAKFLLPVRPGDRLTLAWEEGPAGNIGFTCTAGADQRRVLFGTLRMQTRG